jgi:hypothetical protein
MELIGEEERIRALFSEVRFADEQSVPSFAGVWNRAQARTERPSRALRFSFVAAAALLVCALVSLAWWARRVPQNQNVVIANVPPIAASIEIFQPVKNPEPAKVAQRRFSDQSRSLKLAERRRAVLVAAGKKALRDATAIGSWQSPTATLLSSPSDELLKSLPQLNQTVDELKSFLPSQPKK